MIFVRFIMSCFIFTTALKSDFRKQLQVLWVMLIG